MSRKRCLWAENSFEQYVKYHDQEWGVPVHDDKTLFEFIILESAQAGLSWSTILKRREGYRKAFADFDAKQVAKYTTQNIEKLMEDPGIIRNRAKIEAAIGNAKIFLAIQQEFGSFDKYLWAFVKNEPIVGNHKTQKHVPPTTRESDELSKDLKKRGFKFFGTTIAYAYMQAVGLVNDHTTDCFRFNELTHD